MMRVARPPALELPYSNLLYPTQREFEDLAQLVESGTPCSSTASLSPTYLLTPQSQAFASTGSCSPSPLPSPQRQRQASATFEASAPFPQSAGTYPSQSAPLYHVSQDGTHLVTAGQYLKSSNFPTGAPSQPAYLYPTPDYSYLMPRGMVLAPDVDPETLETWERSYENVPEGIKARWAEELYRDFSTGRIPMRDGLTFVYDEIVPWQNVAIKGDDGAISVEKTADFIICDRGYKLNGYIPEKATKPKRKLGGRSTCTFINYRTRRQAHLSAYMPILSNAHLSVIISYDWHNVMVDEKGNKDGFWERVTVIVAAAWRAKCKERGIIIPRGKQAATDDEDSSLPMSNHPSSQSMMINPSSQSLKAGSSQPMGLNYSGESLVQARRPSTASSAGKRAAKPKPKIGRHEPYARPAGRSPSYAGLAPHAPAPSSVRMERVSSYAGQLPPHMPLMVHRNSYHAGVPQEQYTMLPLQCQPVQQYQPTSALGLVNYAPAAAPTPRSYPPMPAFASLQPGPTSVVTTDEIDNELDALQAFQWNNPQPFGSSLTSPADPAPRVEPTQSSSYLPSRTASISPPWDTIQTPAVSANNSLSAEAWGPHHRGTTNEEMDKYTRNCDYVTPPDQTQAMFPSTPIYPSAISTASHNGLWVQ